MYFEKLVLEVHAKNAGWEAVKPPVVQGKSGVLQKFSFLATDGPRYYGFDIYSDVSEEAVLQTYMKRLDTEALTVIISLSGRPRERVSKLAENYGISILSPGDIEGFFNFDREGLVPTPRPAPGLSE